MASQAPIFRQTSWASLVPQLAFMGLMAVLFYSLNIKQSLTLAAACYLLLSLLLKLLIPKSHRQGIKQIKKGNYAGAIPYFEKSADFFTQHKWIDKYRYITLLSSSRIRYQEMALCNIAFCYSQTNNGTKAKKYYELALKEFPESVLAKAALNLITAIK